MSLNPFSTASIVSGVGILAIGSYMHAYSLRLIFVSGVLVHGLGIYMTNTANSKRSLLLRPGVALALMCISTTLDPREWSRLPH